MSSLVYPHYSQASIVNVSKGEQRAQPEDLVQNFLLLWLDGNLDESNEDFCNSIMQLRRTADAIETFRDPDECFQYISNFEDEKAFLIVSGALTDIVIPRIHNIAQIYTIYIFCHEQSKYEKWATKEWSKVRGIYTDIDSVCASLRQSARECDDGAAIITGEIEPSFMYTTLFKEVVLEIDFDNMITVPDLADYARNQAVYADNKKELTMIEKFAMDYKGNIDNNPIRWYTTDCFVYKMLNKALYKLDVATLLKMGFFMRDLHQNIQQLYQEQIDEKSAPFPTEVYRGQTMIQEDFRFKIQPGKLFSYNNFLSTSEEKNVALDFISRQLQSDNTKVGVLFIMTLDPSIQSAHYVRLAEFSLFPDEKEILFSTHTIFRVRQVKKIHERNLSIWQINLTLTTESDNKQLTELAQSIRQAITGDGWERMGDLLWRMGENRKAADILTLSLNKASSDDHKAYCYDRLGVINCNQGAYETALEFQPEIP